jgi:GMP synthase-like glutamine amidotransferase
MSGRPEQCSLYFSHQDQVIRLPPEAELLGGNAFCPIALFVIGDQVLGIQGHPEFTAGIMKGILAEKEKTLEPQVHAAAVRSLADGAPENRLVAQWVTDFFSGVE